MPGCRHLLQYPAGLSGLAALFCIESPPCAP
ncbi:hypothetical protein D4100_18150 [Serratia inhibens]|uniref:Uncharacterized protein n=1 Tax=Serratia inhibens TaxID=2338073 RepID=A0AA92X3U0_9GAMM|nr:hypothetical protein D4100_18150 [Serratia inhibens]